MTDRVDPYFDENRPHHLRAFEIGYGLDGGGYTVEECEDFGDVYKVAIWESPDCDYFPFMECRHAEVDLLVFDMNNWPEWPKRGTVGGTHYALIESGSVNDSDRDCDCFGVADFGMCAQADNLEKTKQLISLVNYTSADLDEVMTALGVEWEYTGDNFKSLPYPGCKRCDGDGYVCSPAGGWAAYRRTEVPTEANLQAVIDTALDLLTDMMTTISNLGMDDEDTEMFHKARPDYAERLAAVRDMLTVDDEEDKLTAVESMMGSGLWLHQFPVTDTIRDWLYIVYEPGSMCGDGVTRDLVILAMHSSAIVTREVKP